MTDEEKNILEMLQGITSGVKKEMQQNVKFIDIEKVR